MKSIESRKEKIFKGVLESVHKDSRLSGNREAMLVSLTFEKTFAVMIKSFRTELRRDYLKKSKPRYRKFKPSRLQNVE
jgi:hypothetical protein